MAGERELLCTSCKRRPAVYKRTYSGELLCAHCLERALLRGVRRSLGESGLARPRTRIAVPITLSNPLGSLVLAVLLLKLERSYGSETIVLDPLGVQLPRSTARIVRVGIEPGPPRSRDPVECWRFDRRWSLEAARKAGADLVIFPLTRTDLNLLALNALLRGDPAALSEALPHMAWTDPPVVSGFSRVEGELVAAYAGIHGLEVPRGCRVDLSNAKELFYSIAGRRPELEFSSWKSIQLLLKGAESYNRCPACGGFTPEQGSCPYCRRTPLRVTLL